MFPKRKPPLTVSWEDKGPPKNELVFTDTDWSGIRILQVCDVDAQNNVLPPESFYFPILVKEALAKIASKPEGEKLLNEIVVHECVKYKTQNLYSVCIHRPLRLHATPRTKNEAEFQRIWGAGGYNRTVRAFEPDAFNGCGTTSRVQWNPNCWVTDSGRRPPFIGLAHELIHALYNMKGQAFPEKDAEEHSTVGLAGTHREFTENAIRKEHRIELRSRY